MSLTCRRALAAGVVVCASLGASLCVTAGSASASPRPVLVSGNLLVSRLHYSGTPGMITSGVTVLPTGVTAAADGDFAHVWDNATVDGNFGVTAPIYLDQLTPSGAAVNTVAVPAGTPSSASRGQDVLSGSFSSKSEGALNLSTNGSAVTFMGYVAAGNVLDASNGNTPA